jgi:hypothetical protein
MQEALRMKKIILPVALQDNPDDTAIITLNTLLQD